jgi:hypothetical protein
MTRPDKPIKRIWVPKTLALQALAPAPEVQAKPPAPERGLSLFNELPRPESEEKNSDSIWAEFDSVFQTETTPAKIG